MTPPRWIDEDGRELPTRPCPACGRVIPVHTRWWPTAGGEKHEPFEVFSYVEWCGHAGLTGANFEGAVAQRSSDYEVELTVYRRDPKDFPLPINVDKYLVWERVPPRFDVPTLINHASTEMNENMRGFLREHVFLVKKKRDSNHWLPKIPDEIEIVLSGAFRRY